jgi:hypothetical protein
MTQYPGSNPVVLTLPGVFSPRRRATPFIQNIFKREQIRIRIALSVIAGPTGERIVIHATLAALGLRHNMINRKLSELENDTAVATFSKLNAVYHGATIALPQSFKPVPFFSNLPAKMGVMSWGCPGLGRILRLNERIVAVWEWDHSHIVSLIS